MDPVGMTIELRMLAWSAGLGLAHLLLAAGLSTGQRGLRWNAGPRDGEVAPLTGVAARVDRAWRNFLETFAVFAALVLAATLAGRTSAETALGVQLYFWARVAYLPIYAAGIPYLRSAVWAIAFWGIFKLLWAML